MTSFIVYGYQKKTAVLSNGYRSVQPDNAVVNHEYRAYHMKWIHCSTKLFNTKLSF